MEYECIALLAGCREAELLGNLLVDIPIPTKPFATITITCDSETTLRVVSRKKYNNKSRHINFRQKYYVHELLNNGVITVEYACQSLFKSWWIC